jgi:hypothetical protein
MLKLGFIQALTAIIFLLSLTGMAQVASADHSVMQENNMSCSEPDSLSDSEILPASPVTLQAPAATGDALASAPETRYQNPDHATPLRPPCA